MTIEADMINNAVLFATAFGVAFFAALWLGIVFWVIKDIRSRTRDVFLHILSILLVIVLSIPGVLVYLIIRPAKTIEQRYQDALEEESLLQDMEKQIKCPGCGRNVEHDWIICPACHTRLKKLCVNCDKTLDLQWNLCPYCGGQQQKPNTLNKKID